MLCMIHVVFIQVVRYLQDLRHSHVTLKLMVYNLPAIQMLKMPTRPKKGSLALLSISFLDNFNLNLTKSLYVYFLNRLEYFFKKTISQIRFDCESTNGETKIDKPCQKHCRSFFCFGFSIIEFAYRISKRCVCVCMFSYSHKIRIRIKWTNNRLAWVKE